MNSIISWQELSSEESWILKKRLIAVGVFFVFATAIFVVFIFYAGFDGFETGTYIFGAFGLFFYGIIFYMAGILIKDLARGQKMVIRGIVTDKRRHKSSSSRGTGSGGRAGRSGRRGGSSSSPKFYLYFGDEKYYVDQKHFILAHVGQRVELHYAKSSSTSLEIINLEENHQVLSEKRPTSFREILRERKEKIENLPKKETPMSREDLTKLKKQRNRSVRFNLMFVLSFVFMAVIFTLAGLIFWWVMLIPSVVLWLLFIGFSNHIYKTWSKYRKDEIGGIKIVVLTKVTDKQSNTGVGKGFTISTEYGTYSVDKSLYDSVDGQETVFISVGKYSGWLIDVVSR